MRRGAWKSSFSLESRGYSGRTLWEGGARRSHPRYRPWSCGDCSGRPASLRRRRSYCWCMVLGAVAFGGPYGLGSCMCP